MAQRSCGRGNFAFLPMLDDLARERGLSLTDDSASSQLLQAAAGVLKEHCDHKARIHGHHVEAMFAYVAAALGRCRLLTEEDSGFFFDADKKTRRPDYRLVTRDGSQMLIEVKNHHPSDPKAAYRIRRKYLESLKEYAASFAIPLKLAIYWSRWGIWTLTDAASLPFAGDRFDLTLGDACITNEMSMLGDCMLGTEPPLSLRVYADPTRPRDITPEGELSFTIDRATLCSGGNEVTEEIERKIAWYLMLNGSWTRIEKPVKSNRDGVQYIEMALWPEEFSDEEGFATLGHLSAMISRQYLRATTDGDTITNLMPRHGTENFGMPIPSGYKGTALKLWIFCQAPNYEKVGWVPSYRPDTVDWMNRD